jgi:hypothetical protein
MVTWREATMRGSGWSGHGGELTADSTMAEIINKSRGNGHWTLVYMPLQENLGGEARKGVLTRGGASAAARVPTGRLHV